MKQFDIISLYEKMTFTLGDAAVTFLFTTSSKGFSSISDKTNLHLHQGAEIHFLFDGEYILYTAEDTPHTLTANTVCILPPKYSHTLRSAGKDCQSFATTITVEPSVKNDKKSPEDGEEFVYYRELFESLSDVIILENADDLLSCADAFLRTLQKPHFDSKYLADALLQILFLTITGKISSAKGSYPQTDFLRENDNNILECVIMNNYLHNLSIEDVAEQIGYSVAYTSKLIKKIYGMTYSELIMKLKMSYARQKITETDRSIREIAADAGYSSYNGFSLAFKKQFGTTPEQMRKDVIS